MRALPQLVQVQGRSTGKVRRDPPARCSWPSASRRVAAPMQLRRAAAGGDEQGSGLGVLVMDRIADTTKTLTSSMSDAMPEVLSKPSARALLMINLAPIIGGLNQVGIKEAEEILSPAAFSALRFTIAALCFTPVLKGAFADKRVRNKGFELAVYLFFGYIFQSVGLSMTTASRSAVTATFYILTVPFLVGMTGRRIPRSTWIAAAVAVMGVVVLESDPAQVAPNWGDLFCILSALAFGAHKFRSEIVVTSLPDKAAQIMGIQFASIAATSCVFAAPEFAGVAQGGVGGVLQAAQGVPWPLVLALGTVNTAGVLFMELVALKDVSAPLTALVYSAEPVYGSALAWWLLGERWGINGWIGAGLIMGSTAYSQFSGDQAEKARAEDL